jgi:hypothetical protein
MVIHIPIYLDHALIKTYRIERISGGTDPESINTYLIVEEGFDPNTGQIFNHRYGDSIETCVAKGLSAIIE